MAKEKLYVVQNARQLGILSDKTPKGEVVILKMNSPLFPNEGVQVELKDGVHYFRVATIYFHPGYELQNGSALGVELETFHFIPRGFYE